MDSLKILEGLEVGQIAAILQRVSGGDKDKLQALLRDEVEIQLVKRMLKLFDKNGRRIPPKVLQNAVCDPDKNFQLIQPRFKTMDDYAQRLIRFQQMFYGLMSAAEFEGKVEELVSEIKSTELLVNLLKGIYLPIILPKIEVKNFDYGTTLENMFLSAVKKAYEAQFPGRSFYNYRKGELAKQVSIVEGSRHELLVERMKQGIVYAIYFPNSLQGFSALASREQMSTIPESLLLYGGFDASAAMVMYPDILARDFKTPGYDLSALQWRSSGYSLYFGAYDDELGFDYGAPLGFALDDYSSGFLFLGSA